MSEPTTEAGRDWRRLNELRDAIIEAVRAQDGVGGVKAFQAYDDFIEAEARASQPLTSRQEVRFIPQACPVCGAFIRVAQPLPSAS